MSMIINVSVRLHADVNEKVDMNLDVIVDGNSNQYKANECVWAR